MQFGYVGWRMAADDYIRAATSGKPLIGSPADTPWDPCLATDIRPTTTTSPPPRVRAGFDQSRLTPLVRLGHF